MPLFKVEQQERVLITRTYTLTASDEDEAYEAVANDEVQCGDEYYEQLECETFVTEIATNDAEWALDPDVLEDLGL